MADITAAQALSMGADAVYLSNRPLPDAPTGYYDWQITTDPSDDREGHSTITNLVNRVEAFGAKGGFRPDPIKVVSLQRIFFLRLLKNFQSAFVDTVQHPQAVDDRKGAVCRDCQQMSMNI